MVLHCVYEIVTYIISLVSLAVVGEEVRGLREKPS